MSVYYMLCVPAIVEFHCTGSVPIRCMFVASHMAWESDPHQACALSIPRTHVSSEIESILTCA